MPTATVTHTDALSFLRSLPAASVDAVITDPPYPGIKREYGTWTEPEWFAMMNPIVEECRRVLTATGSAVFVIQPNSERVGRMRLWWLRFMLEWGERWGLVQDAWWWNPAILPNGGATTRGMMRASVKPLVWLGCEDCYRDQDSVLWEPNWNRIAAHAETRATRSVRLPSGNNVDYRRIAEATTRRGGSTPFNLLPITNANSQSSAGAHGHGAGTPLALARWWVRYICPPGGTVADPFSGSGTVQLAALAEGRNAIGSERMAKYVDIARRRIAEFVTPPPAKPKKPAWPIDFGDLDTGAYTFLFSPE